MITFGYKSRYNGLARAIVALVLGLVMVIIPGTAIDLVVKLIAVLFIASGVVSLIFGLRKKQKNELVLLVFNAIVDVILGVVLFMYPDFFVKIVFILIGLALLGFGIMQIIALVGASSLLGLGFWAFIIPVLVTIAGGFLVFNPFAQDLMCIIAGVTMICYSVSELWSAWKMQKAQEEYEIRFTSGAGVNREETAASDFKDVDFEKVDEQ